MTRSSIAVNGIARAPAGTGPFASRFTRSLVLCGAAAGPLFVTVILAQAVTRPGFTLTRDAASLLDDGSWGWIQVVNFIVTGLLFIAAGVGLRRTLTTGRGSKWIPRLLILAGAGLAGGGVFHPDPSNGFPPGTPPGASAVSDWHGILHQICGSAAFLALIVLCVVLARRLTATGERPWAACSWAAAALCTAGIVTGGTPHGSLTLFIGVSIAMLWIAFMSALTVSQNKA